MKLIISFLLLFSTGMIARAQTSYYVTGKVVNQVSGQPMQGASVFAQNTTFGTATDADGNFKLYLPNGGYDLVVTFTGYNTESRRVTTADQETRDIVFQLKLREKEMTDIMIIASSEVKDGWEKYGNFFTEQFIGKTDNSKNCTLKNPDVLHFFFSKRKNRLKVTAAEPLVIENKALGYTIKYALDSFTHEYATEVSLYTGYPLFEEIIPADDHQKTQWATARQAAYRGSILHFMRSVYNKSLKSEGFEVQFLVKSNNVESAVKLADVYGALNYKKDDSTNIVEVRPNQLDIGVLYTREKPAAGYIRDNEDQPKEFQFSQLTFQPNEHITIEQNGYYYEQNDLTISEYWTWDKVADLLPYDYLP